MDVREDRGRIRIVLLDEHGLVRRSLARLLSLESDFEIAGEFATEEEARELLKQSSIDLVLLDFNRGVEQANRFISACRGDGYQGRFLIVAADPEASSTAAAFKLGASGIFLKSDPPERLVQAIRFVQSGAIWIDPNTIQRLAEQCVGGKVRPPRAQAGAPLDEREKSVLSGILGGSTNRAIGASMGIAETSVKNILQRLFAKAGVRTRSQLVRLAMEGSFGSLGQPRQHPPRRGARSKGADRTATKSGDTARIAEVLPT